MLPKYRWLLFLATIVYALYSSDYYYSQVNNLVKGCYRELRRFYVGDDDDETAIKEGKDGEALFTQAALRRFDNEKDGLYLAILGEVFDVTQGAKFYGPGETYNAFIGRDGSAAFISGDFTDDGLTDDVSRLSHKQIQSLIGWTDFYRKTYKYKGKLIGRFYTEDGSPTEERLVLDERVQVAKRMESDLEQIKLKFPPCNVEWEPHNGTKVWCTKYSGGVTREWIGVPRQFYHGPKPDQYRCACVNLYSEDYEKHKKMFKLYDNCKKNSVKCLIVPKDK